MQAWAVFLGDALGVAPAYRWIEADENGDRTNVGDVAQAIAGWKWEAAGGEQRDGLSAATVAALWEHVHERGRPAALGTAARQSAQMRRLKLYAAHNYAVLGAVPGVGGAPDCLVVHNPHNKLKGGPGPLLGAGAPRRLHRQSSLAGDDLDADGKAADDFLLSLEDLAARGVFTRCDLMYPAEGRGVD